MIGTHNTLTALQPKFSIFKPFGFLWKCQDRIGNADFADIRIRWNGSEWVGCHGIVDLNITFSGWKDIETWLNFWGYSKARIVLERGNPDEFLEMWEKHKSYPGKIVEVVIKKPWTVLWRDPSINYSDHYYEYWDWNKGFFENIWNNLKKRYTLRSWIKDNPFFPKYIGNKNVVELTDFL